MKRDAKGVEIITWSHFLLLVSGKKLNNKKKKKTEEGCNNPLGRRRGRVKLSQNCFEAFSLLFMICTFRLLLHKLHVKKIFVTYLNNGTFNIDCISFGMTFSISHNKCLKLSEICLRAFSWFAHPNSCYHISKTANVQSHVLEHSSLTCISCVVVMVIWRWCFVPLRYRVTWMFLSGNAYFRTLLIGYAPFLKVGVNFKFANSQVI